MHAGTSNSYINTPAPALVHRANIYSTDTVAASSFQMQEAFSGYRQSNDVASKRRVREAINAALTSLPEWPQPLPF